MCRYCDKSGLPYLAGLVVLFPLPARTVKLWDPDTARYITIEPDRAQRGYIGRCVNHHLGWTRIHTRTGVYAVKAQALLAYIPPDPPETPSEATEPPETPNHASPVVRLPKNGGLLG